MHYFSSQYELSFFDSSRQHILNQSTEVLTGVDFIDYALFYKISDMWFRMASSFLVVFE